jgi:hypothetical protein
MSQSEGTRPVPDYGPAGIGGWLVFPALGLILILLYYTVYAAANAVYAPSDGAELARVVLSVSVAFFALYCTVRFFQKKAQVPALMIAFYVVVLFANALVMTPAMVDSIDDHTRRHMTQGFHFVMQLAASLLWIVYFSRSRRVKATFVR